MAIVTDCNGFTVADGTGHVDGSTLNAPRTKTVQGLEMNAIGWGTISATGTDGSVVVQQIIGFEDADNSHPSTFQRINTFGGAGYGEWLKIG
jgi:hypothetical protein